MSRRLLVLFVCMACMTLTVSAHPGKTENGEWALEDTVAQDMEDAEGASEMSLDYNTESASSPQDPAPENGDGFLRNGSLVVLVLIGVFCVLLFRQNAKQTKASQYTEEFAPAEAPDHPAFAPTVESDIAPVPEPPADLGALRYGPVGTGWLKFLTYVGLPLQAVINYFTLSDADLSNLAPAAYVPYFALLAYLVAFPLAAAILLHFRQPKAYFLIQYLLFSNALLNLCLVFLFPSAAIDTVQAAAGSIIWGFIWFFYLKKRRFLFEQEGISRAEFDAIGVKVSYGIVAAFAIAAASLAYLAYQ